MISIFELHIYRYKCIVSAGLIWGELQRSKDYKGNSRANIYKLENQIFNLEQEIKYLDELLKDKGIEMTKIDGIEIEPIEKADYEKITDFSKQNASLMLREEFPEVPFVGTFYGVDLRELEKDDILRAFKLAIRLEREGLMRKVEITSSQLLGGKND